MKKSLLILSAMFAMAAATVSAQSTAVFDFTSADALKEANIDNVEANPTGYATLTGKNFKLGSINLTFNSGSSYSNPEWYKASELYVYNNTDMVVTAVGEGCHITKIEFDANQWPYVYDSDVTATPTVANGFKINDSSEYAFVANADTQYTYVKFDFFDRGRFNKITVTYEGGESSVADIAVDADAQPVYYNLQGVQVDAGNLTPGLYISRQGTRTTKILVK